MRRPVGVPAQEEGFNPLKFRTVDRGYREWMLLLPGWGFMPDIFSRLDLGYSYILPEAPLTGDITDHASMLTERLDIKKIHLFGWSLGATVAAIFALKRPDIMGNICLVSVMKHFPVREMERVMKDIRKDKKRALKNFHRLCFTGQKKDLAWFRANLQETAIKRWNIQSLEAGLRFLVDNPFDTDILACDNVACFHGSRDIVAPLSQTPCSETSRLNIIRGAGHLPFLTQEFPQALRQGGAFPVCPDI